MMVAEALISAINFFSSVPVSSILGPDACTAVAL
jgi:hypothetical protein